jgi:hypothetical protein
MRRSPLLPLPNELTVSGLRFKEILLVNVAECIESKAA